MQSHSNNVYSDSVTPVDSQGTFTYILRPLVERDIPDFVSFINECASLEKAVEPVTLDEWVEWYHNPTNRERYILALLRNDTSNETPGVDPQAGQYLGDDEERQERDARQDASEGGGQGRIIGYFGFGINPPDTKSWGWLHVHPAYRNHGLGSALYAEYIRQSEEAGANEQIVVPSRYATLLIEFLEKRGHVLERWFWDMQLPAEQTVELATTPEGFHMRTFVHDQDEELVTHVRNVTFADHYGSVSRTVEEMTYRTKQQDFHADGVFFAFDGEEIAGFCYTSRDTREWERRGEKVGHIQLLGVMPNYRGRGLGRSLLLTAANYLREFVDLVELGVEGKNDNALALYESVGFCQHKAWGNMIRARWFPS
jgi:mycothiol synthase